MTRAYANNDAHFEIAPLDHILRPIDRMRRVNAESANTLEWFPIAPYDCGLNARYFSRGGFVVEKRKDNAP